MIDPVGFDDVECLRNVAIAIRVRECWLSALTGRDDLFALKKLFVACAVQSIGLVVGRDNFLELNNLFLGDILENHSLIIFYANLY